MNLRDLEAFVALAETGSIKRAALHLRLTQPATTRRVQNFEASIRGAVLLDRSVKPAALTHAGTEVLSHCRRILRAVAELKECASVSPAAMGELRIGVSPGLAGAILSSPFDELCGRFPNVQLRIRSQWTAELIEAIERSALDCAVALLTDHHRLPSGVTGTQIGVEALAVVGARDMDLPPSSKRNLLLRNLRSIGWVLNPAGCGYRDALFRACDRAGVTCRVVADVLGYDLQLSMVAKGAALGLVPRRLIDKSPLRKRLRTIDLTDFAPEARIIVLRGAALGNLSGPVDELQACISTAINNKRYA
jgi:DNA-binding transcriptional LysR family regulator